MSTVSYARWLTLEPNHDNNSRDEDGTEFGKESKLEKAGKSRERGASGKSLSAAMYSRE